MRPAVTVRGLEKAYGPRRVLRGLDLEVRRGEIFALLGANGAGKTTALECIEGLRRCDAGEISVDGRLGVQLQSGALPGHLRAMEAVRLFALWNGTAPDGAMLAELGVDRLGKRPYAAMSAGQKRRLHLALALLRRPDVLVLDEPTAGLDVEGRSALHGCIRRLRDRGCTVLLSSHDAAEVERLCDRLAVLRDGRAVFCGTPSELAARSPRTVAVRTADGWIRRETGDVGGALLALLEDARRRGAAVLDVEVGRGALEHSLLELLEEGTE